MEINQNNINEKFLLALLDRTDVVYHSGEKDQEYFYFYPQGLKCTVEVPLYNSQHVDVNFIFQDINRKRDEVVNFSLSSFDEIKTFISEIYKKHEFLLNSSYQDSYHLKEKFDYFLTHNLSSPTPFSVEGNCENLRLLTNKYHEEEIIINLGKELYKYDSQKIFKPLSPIVIECFYKAKTNLENKDRFYLYKRVIPAYDVEKFPIVNKYVKVINSSKDIHSLSDALNEINPDSAKLISSIILDVELSNENSSKKNKSKI